MAHSKTYGRVDSWDPEAFTRARVDADVTLDSIASRLGVARSTVHSWARSGRPRADLLPSIAHILRVPQRKLTGRAK